jgi:hypothetical protein
MLNVKRRVPSEEWQELFKNITFRNIRYNSTNVNPNQIYGFDSGRIVDGMSFVNLRINRELILDEKQGNFDINSYARRFSFVWKRLQISMLKLASLFS